MATTIVLYPSPGMGHLVSMVELGKHILNHHPQFSIIVLTILPPFNTGTTASYIKHVSTTTTSAISFHQLPSTAPKPLDTYPSMEAITIDLIDHVNPQVHDALQSISLKSPISAFIIDFFCTSALSVSLKFDFPTYYFFTSGVNCLALFLYLPILHNLVSKSYKDLDENLDVPSLPPIPASHVPTPVLDRESVEYAFFMSLTSGLTKSAGILVNSFDSLEYKALEACSAGKFVLDSPTPPLFCIGPLIASGDGRKGSTSVEGGVHDCIKWLDKQPSKSVVYLSFGSLGVFSADQILEIANGLERSDQRFLWVVRSPPSQDKTNRFLPPSDPDLDTLLPQGFLERTKDKGFIIKSWAPQIEILNHESVGGFVTHCGWNSVLEAVMAGVPLIAWPLYAEQKFNKVILVEELKLALPVNEFEGGFVKAEEVERRVRELLHSDQGKALKERAQAKKKEARDALSHGGSSTRALAELVSSWKLT